MWREMREDTNASWRMHFGDRSTSLFQRLRVSLTSRGLFALMLHRMERYCARERRRGRGLQWAVIRLAVAVSSPLRVWWAKADLLASCETEGGVWLSDRGYFVIGAKRIGRGTVVHDHVTIGMDVTRNDGGAPTIGRDVWIGPNCVIHSKITVGDGATILPNTVLSKSVPDHVVVRGNPGRVVLRGYDNRALRSRATVVETLPGLAERDEPPRR